MEKVLEERIEIPGGTDVSIEWPSVKVKGPKGTLQREFKGPMLRFFEMEKKGNEIVIRSSYNRRKMRAMIGTIRAHIRNMIGGVTEGYVYKMKIHYVHFPITMEIKGDKIIVKNFLGERTIRKTSIVGKTKVEQKKDDIVITGIDKEDVAQTAANIENSCRLSRKDRRTFLDGIYITEKDAR